MAEDESESKAEQRTEKLSFKDYIALSIAAFETFLLPLLVLVAVMVALALVFAATR